MFLTLKEGKKNQIIVLINLCLDKFWKSILTMHVRFALKLTEF